MQVENGSAKAAGNLFGLASARDSHGGEWTKRALKQSVASVRMAAFERMTELLAAFFPCVRELLAPNLLKPRCPGIRTAGRLNKKRSFAPQNKRKPDLKMDNCLS